MKAPETKLTIVISDGNAFAIMGTAQKVLKKAGADKEYTDKYLKEAMSGDYDHLLAITSEYIETEE